MMDEIRNTNDVFRYTCVRSNHKIKTNSGHLQPKVDNQSSIEEICNNSNCIIFISGLGDPQCLTVDFIYLLIYFKLAHNSPLVKTIMFVAHYRR